MTERKKRFSRTPSYSDLGSKLSLSRLRDSFGTIRRISGNTLGDAGSRNNSSDGQFSTPPQLKMPELSTPFESNADSHDSPALSSLAPDTPKTAHSSLVPESVTSDGASDSVLSPTLSHTMSTTTLIEQSPALSSDGSPWIGGTGLGSASLGKSGRVIEKLMAENDRLRREMKAEIAKREELQQAAQSSKPRFEALQAENARLSHCKAVDASVIRRRDRKIEDLKEELSVERQKREALESRTQEAERKMGEFEDHANKEVQLAVETAKHATTHATILETSHKQLGSEYRQRVASVNKQLRELNDDKEEDRKRLVKLDIVNHQMRQENEKARKMYNDLLATWDKYTKEKDSEVDKLQNDLRQLKDGYDKREVELQKTSEEMNETMNRMKWVMAVQKVVNENGVNSPPPSPSN